MYLATDPDREGEAISWHLMPRIEEVADKDANRITFNEITKNAVKASIKQPRETRHESGRCTAGKPCAWTVW